MVIEVNFSIRVVDIVRSFAIPHAGVSIAPLAVSVAPNAPPPGSSTFQVATDSQGRAQFSNVEVGTYTVAIQAHRYRAVTVDGVIIEENNQSSIDRSSGRLIPPGSVINVQGSVPLVKLDPVDYLRFDGSELCWMKGIHQHRCWRAVSGRTGYQSSSHQRTVGMGPLPEGAWHVRQSRYQFIGSRNPAEQLAGEFGRTAWPGGESAWGRHRIWLDPMRGTNTYSRSGFSIHGGDDPGSAGCIDMTTNMSNFIREFHRHGRNLELEVRY